MHVDKTTATRRYVLSPRRAAAVLGAGVLLCLAAMSARSVYATMPSAPLEMVLESTGVVAVDVDLTVTLTVRPLIDAERVKLAITLPEGVDLVAGETGWVGPVRAQESRVLSVTVRPRRAAFSVIQGAARMEFPDGTVLGDIRSMSLPLGERSKQTLGVSPPKKTTTGESVIEFRDAP
jgi:hypothetical protein